MSELFPKHIIDLENGTVWSKKYKHYIGSYNDGYLECSVFDCFRNRYTKVHQVILAEGLQLPKHLWPIDSNGRRYEPDHIEPISMGGDNSFKNLRLVSKKDNSNNPNTKENQSKARKNVVITDEWKKHLGEAQKKAWKEGKHTISQAFLDSILKRAKERSVPVDVFNLEGEFIIGYSSASQAAKQTGYNKERIRCHCEDGKPYKNLIWRRWLV